MAEEYDCSDLGMPSGEHYFHEQNLLHKFPRDAWESIMRSTGLSGGMHFTKWCIHSKKSSELIHPFFDTLIMEPLGEFLPHPSVNVTPLKIIIGGTVVHLHYSIPRWFVLLPFLQTFGSKLSFACLCNDSGRCYNKTDMFHHSCKSVLVSFVVAASCQQQFVIEIIKILFVGCKSSARCQFHRCA
jgi:hypothetical protein